MQDIGKIIIGIGLLLVLTGFILYFFGNKLEWFGNLPGDIRIEKENFKFYMPITTMILISVVISFVVYVIRRIF